MLTAAEHFLREAAPPQQQRRRRAAEGEADVVEKNQTVGKRKGKTIRRMIGGFTSPV
jgi:hypothetical protein